MAALEFGERVPMPIEQARKDFRFYFALFHLFIALFVARIIFTIRVNGRHKDDVLSVWRPDGAVGASGNRSDLMRLLDQLPCFGIENTHPDLCWIGRFRGPNQTLAVD